MFDSLAEQMRNDERVQTSNFERTVRWMTVAVLSLVIFGGLFFGVHYLQ